MSLVIKGMNITYGETTVLKDIFLFCPPGAMLLVLGESGAGKSTLVRIISGVYDTSEHNPPECRQFTIGDVNIIKGDQLKGYIGIVSQNNILHEMDTVREAVEFSYRMHGTDEEEITPKSNILLTHLALNDIQARAIGSEMSTRDRISGGERRRVTLATGLTKECALLISDEATSGLDPFSALKVIAALKRMTELRKIPCLAVLHQPTPEMVSLFSYCLVLTHSEVSFFGRVPRLKQRLLEASVTVPGQTNITDLIVDIFDNRNDNSIDNAQKRSIYDASVRCFNEEMSLFDETETILHEPRSFKASFTVQFNNVLKRSFKARTRSSNYITSRIFGTLFIVIIGILSFVNLSRDQEAITSITGAIFWILASASFSPLFMVIWTTESIKELFRWERYNHMYSVLVFVLSTFFAVLTFEFISASFALWSQYWIFNLSNDFVDFLTFWAAIIITVIGSSGIGLVSISLFEAKIASVFGISVQIIFILYSGFYFPLDTVPGVLRWIGSISYVRWSVEIIIVSQFNDMVFSCTDDQKLPNGSCPIPNGEVYLRNRGLENSKIGENFIYLSIVVTAYWIIFYITTRLFLRKISLFQRPIKRITSDTPSSSVQVAELTANSFESSDVIQRTPLLTEE
ncbi:hypothetical protein PCE1_004222 [Barthelona sp. PCE]